jgi:hypothetical protein
MGVAVIVGTQKGAVILSSEDRRRWETSPLLLKGWLVTAATRDTAGRTYLGVTHDVWGAAVMASDDLESWEQLEGAPRYGADLRGNEEHLRIIGAMDPGGQFTGGGRYVDQIWKLHADGRTLYAGVSEAGLFRSDDGGKSWKVSEGLDQHETRPDWGAGFGGLCAHTVLTDASNPERIWVGISAAGVFRSEDGGRTFTEKNDGVNKAAGYCVHSLAHDPNDADRIYRQDHRGVYRTDDGGDSWEVIESGLPISELGDGHRCTFGFAIKMDAATGRIFVIPMEGDSFRFPHSGRLAVYHSDDGGDSWSESTNGLPANFYGNVLRGAMAVDGLAPCGVYFGATSGFVYGSNDRGDSWQELTSSLPKILCVEAFAA